jgi:hypothetical protein
MFNTASVVGVACNIFTYGFPSKHIPSFSWISGEDSLANELKKVLEAANNMMSRRGLSISTNDEEILTHLSKTRD